MEPRISSWQIAKTYRIAHRNITRLVNDYTQELMDISPIHENINTTQGRSRPVREFLLTEDQMKFIVAMMGNTEATIQLKRRMFVNPSLQVVG